MLTTRLSQRERLWPMEFGRHTIVIVKNTHHTYRDMERLSEHYGWGVLRWAVPIRTREEIARLEAQEGWPPRDEQQVRIDALAEMPNGGDVEPLSLEDIERLEQHVDSVFYRMFPDPVVATHGRPRVLVQSPAVAAAAAGASPLPCWWVVEDDRPFDAIEAHIDAIVSARPTESAA